MMMDLVTSIDDSSRGQAPATFARYAGPPEGVNA
jgi:hypothetical protein